MDKVYLGLDPGKSGALAWIRDDECGVCAWPPDLRDAWELLRRFQDSLAFCALERVHSFPHQGVKSMFTFGQYYGRQEALLVAAGVRIEHVLPQRWQAALGCLTKGDKRVSLERARSLFPNLKCSQREADAVLLAEYARRLQVQQPAVEITACRQHVQA